VPGDIPRIVALGRENFAAIHGTDAGYDPAAAARFLQDVVFERGAVFLSRAGIIGGVLCPVWHAPGIVEAVEMMWFARDGMGGLLLRKWCVYAERNRAVPVVTSRSMSPALAQRLRLKPAETVWKGY
jgi:hypothetical protein